MLQGKFHYAKDIGPSTIDALLKVGGFSDLNSNKFNFSVMGIIGSKIVDSEGQSHKKSSRIITVSFMQISEFGLNVEWPGCQMNAPLGTQMNKLKKLIEKLSFSIHARAP